MILIPSILLDCKEPTMIGWCFCNRRWHCQDVPALLKPKAALSLSSVWLYCSLLLPNKDPHQTLNVNGSLIITFPYCRFQMATRWWWALFLVDWSGGFCIPWWADGHLGGGAIIQVKKASPRLRWKTSPIPNLWCRNCGSLSSLKLNFHSPMSSEAWNWDGPQCKADIPVLAKSCFACPRSTFLHVHLHFQTALEDRQMSCASTAEILLSGLVWSCFWSRCEPSPNWEHVCAAKKGLVYCGMLNLDQKFGLVPVNNELAERCCIEMQSLESKYRAYSYGAGYFGMTDL